MVTCQSANQLKTPAEVSLAFKMVSQFGSLGYTNPEATPKPNPILSSTFLGKVHCKYKECEHSEHTKICQIPNMFTAHLSRKANILVFSYRFGYILARICHDISALWDIVSECLILRACACSRMNSKRCGSWFSHTPVTGKYSSYPASLSLLYSCLGLDWM